MTRLVLTGARGYLGGAVAAAAANDPSIELRSVVRRPAPWLPGEVLCLTDLVRQAARAVEGADAVVHLAGANEVVTKEDPDAAVGATIASSRAVAAACASAGVPRLVYVSTVHVYGEALRPGAVVDEDTLPAPRHPYAIARLASEHSIFGSAGATEVIVLRLTNAIGAPASPGVERWSLIGNDLCRQAASGGPLRLLTPGLQWRDFVALADVVRAIVGAAVAVMAPGVYNLASGHSITVRDLAATVAAEAERMGLGAMDVVTPPGHPGRATEAFRVSTTKMDATGFSVAVPLEEAIADTLTFCQSVPARG